MKKILLALAACAISAAAFAQPMPSPRGPEAERKPPPVAQRRVKQKKVWVPAHRKNGRPVRGQYVWR
jgi:Ni/Co efflux regulator RcnB